MIALRQQSFFKELSRQGHQVLVVSPGQWGREKTEPYEEGSFRLVTCRHMGEDIYSFHLLGASAAILAFQPDWIYVQQEAASSLSRLGLAMALDTGCRKAIFVWENLRKPSRLDTEVLGSYDLVVCGNDEAERIVKEATAVFAGRTPGPPRTVILPQVGVDTDHFQARPIQRDDRAVFIGRDAPEKGFALAQSVWPTLRALAFTPFKALPWAYSSCQLVVSPSVDTNFWLEQAMPYVAVEANACLTPVIAARAGSIPFWQERWAGPNPGVRLVAPLGKVRLAEDGRSIQVEPGPGLVELAQAIPEVLNDQARRVEMGRAGREWVVQNLSNPVIAKKLVEALDGD